MSDYLDDTGEMSSTQPLRSPDRPVSRADTPQRVPTVPPNEPRKRKRRDRSRSPLYLPVWSIGLMLLLVIGIAGGVVLLLLTLGGGVAPAGEPRFIIITAAPTETPSINTQTPAFITAPAPTSAQAGEASIPLPTFALEGPTLPPVVLTPTPLTITVGAPVIIARTDLLNMRDQPGLNTTVIDQAVEFEQFTVIAGPEQVDSLTWWQIQDQIDPTRTGWVAADYLVVAQPGS